MSQDLKEEWVPIKAINVCKNYSYGENEVKILKNINLSIK